MKRTYLVLCRYLAIAGDVLTSVKKTEDSLMRLKRTRKAPSNPTATSGTSGITDDSKIRLQFSLDIQQYKQLVSQCCVTAATSKRYQLFLCS